ncbi:tyrosine-type recombinase/integrase [Streptomyces niveus]|uniref:tyrosine-type recombinase/integrase n=1 Tax=Streptomyces niveus TaxID=193462 RepID=UPI0035D5A554
MDPLPAPLVPAVAPDARTVPMRALRGTPPASGPDALLQLLHQTGADAPVLDATRSWISDITRRLSVHSQTAYAKDVSWWLAWCTATKASPTAARPIDADRYAAALRETGFTTATCRRRLAAASSWCGYLIRADVAMHNPFAGMQRPSVSADTPTTRSIPLPELATLLTYARENESARNYALLVTLATTGERIGSVLGATVGALGTDQGHRTADLPRGSRTKSGRTKPVVLVPLAVHAIETYLAERPEAAVDEPLFATRTGRPMDEPSVYRLLQRVAKAAGIDGADEIAPRSLRYSYATALLNQGVPLTDVQHAMGHADPRTTWQYARLAEPPPSSPSYRMQDELTKAMRTAE